MPLNIGIFAPAVDDMVGKVFTRLTVLCEVDKVEGDTARRYECVCDCGRHSTVRRSALICGQTKSCGCFNEGYAQGWHTSKAQTFTCFQCHQEKSIACRTASPAGKPICGSCDQRALRMADPREQRRRATRANHNTQIYKTHPEEAANLC